MSSRTRYYNRYRPYRSGLSGRTKRQQRSADQQRDTTNVVINTNYSFDCGQTMNQIYMDRGDDGWFDTGCAAINIYDILRKSSYFSDFSKMYDQFRVNNIRAKIIATNWATSREESNTDEINEIIKARSYIIVTAWDRTGLSKEQVEIRTDWNDAIINHKFYTKLGKSITSYSSAKTKHLGPGNAYEIIRQLYPENNYEKSQFISTALLKGQYTKTNTDNFAYNCFYKKVVPVDQQHPYGYEYVAYDFDSKYPCNILSDPSCPFKPTLLVNVISGPNPYVTNFREKDEQGFDTVLTRGLNKIKPVTFDVEFDIDVTFRGLRYNKIINDEADIYVPPLLPLYKANEVTVGDFLINTISISDSKYNNLMISNIPYSFGELVRKNELPNKEQSRYVVYLKLNDVVRVGNEDRNVHTIRVINYGANKFTKQFNEANEIYLGEFLADPYNANEDTIDYLNVRMTYSKTHADPDQDHPDEPPQPLPHPINTVCFQVSYKLNVQPVEANTPANIAGTPLFVVIGNEIQYVPQVYRFVDQQNPNDHQNDMNQDPPVPEGLLVDSDNEEDMSE